MIFGPAVPAVAVPRAPTGRAAIRRASPPARAAARASADIFRVPRWHTPFLF